MKYRVLFTPEAEDHLDELYRYIAEAADSAVAARHVDAVISYCEGLDQFPARGRARDDLRPGLPTISYKKRTVIAFAFAIREDTVAILGSSTAGVTTKPSLASPTTLHNQRLPRFGRGGADTPRVFGGSASARWPPGHVDSQPLWHVGGTSWGRTNARLALNCANSGAPGRI